MKPLSVAFLWHMHQPIYKEGASGKYLLPWVRLHSLKGYTDLPVLSEKNQGFRQTINFTPSLLVQLDEYVNNPAIKDDFLEITKKPADKLTEEDKQFILKNFFMNNLERIIHPHLRYNELFQKRGHRFIPQEAQTYLKRFSTQDFLDLQVLFNLMWFGFSARKIYPRLEVLIKKNRNYSEEEKLEVIELQWQVMRDIIPRLKRLQESGKLELTCSPFYHPILPLISKHSEKDQGFGWQEDAKWQITKARDLFENFFGVKPQGMWPSEGSVSESAVSLIAESGFRWIATDEEILLHSLANPKREQEIYEPHQISFSANPLNMFFRDKVLSDLIGFGYHRSSHVDAVEDLIRRLHNIQEQVSTFTGNHVVSIVLDGENPWEFYPEGGEPFLNLLIERLAQEPRLKTVTFSDYLDDNPQSKRLEKLYAGSWINHNFNIWYKHSEDLAAWKIVDETRKFVKHEETALAPEIREKVWNEIYMAEASDWYWWFGDEFFTETGDIFDHLFRSHLIQAYHLLGKRTPGFLRDPIKSVSKPHLRFEPQGLIQPVLDGKVTHYYEWANAGLYQREHLGGAMYESSQILDSIYYGFNLTDLFLRLELREKPDAEHNVVIHIQGRQDFDVQFPVLNPKSLEVFKVDEHSRAKISTLTDSIATEKIIELKIPFEVLNGRPGDTLNFSVAVYKNDVKLEECPRNGMIQTPIPGKDYEAQMWSV
ncbi:MAG: hypothetical protein HZC17_05830 [Candidatus Omnitrophica bacterium]|nr:hypothetical protein [Candidatus Omnitrophota bacterium]